MNEAISCSYRLGARSVLPQNWYGYNLCLPDSKLYYVEKGQIVLQIYDQTITAGPGDLLLIPAQTVHSCWLTEDCYAEKSWCHFSLKNGTNEFFENFIIPPMIHVKNRALVKRLFCQLFSSHTMPIPQKTLTATTAICSLVHYYFAQSEISLREIASDRIYQVITYIDQHYTENITLDQLTQIANYSTTYMSKCFRNATGLPPIRYLNNVRIERAKYLLQFSNDSIGRIMEQCGFSDAAYFSRTFKKMLGYSPQTFRNLYHRSTVRK
jgi:AraC-like DNA-binding protein